MATSRHAIICWCHDPHFGHEPDLTEPATDPGRVERGGREWCREMAVTLGERHANVPTGDSGPRTPHMEKFVIEGGVPLSGTMVPAGNKNGALPILASALLTEDEVVVQNVPRIRDVDAMLSILSAIGVAVSWRGPNEVALCAADVHEVEIERELAELIRASFLLAGPLLARFGRAVMPPPGGDVIGRRRLDPHLDAFRAMGATAECGREIVLSAPSGLRATDVFMDEPSVMATENALMATGEATASAYAGRRGVPAYFPSAVFAALGELTGDAGARELLREARAVELEGGELDIDTPEALDEARRQFA